jgi:hypothetical protein
MELHNTEFKLSSYQAIKLSSYQAIKLSSSQLLFGWQRGTPNKDRFSKLLLTALERQAAGRAYFLPVEP